MMGFLYIIGTPIGNLEDITLRALRILKEVDFVVCEEPHITRKLLAHYRIVKPVLSYHQHSRPAAVRKILTLLEQGKSLAYVTSAGTPGVSDPGPRLIHEVVERFGDTVSVVPIPGPSAVTVIASIADIPMDEFHFFGYPPAKRKRAKFFGKVRDMESPSILFESPHRIRKTLQELQDAVGSEREIVVGRELTKKFETVYRGTVGEVKQRIDAEKPRGEYVLLLGFPPKRR